MPPMCDSPKDTALQGTANDTVVNAGAPFESLPCRRTRQIPQLANTDSSKAMAHSPGDNAGKDSMDECACFNCV